MNARHRKIVVYLLTLSLVISGCGPGQLFGATPFISVAAGDSHTCALTAEGKVKCWGSNEYGQLGDGTIDQRATPMDVVDLIGTVSAIAPGGLHTCALMANGGIKCWGSNSYGQLGDGTTNYRLTPVDVIGLNGAASAITTGYNHTCALMKNGRVKCWGINGYGQLGDGEITTTAPYGKPSPVEVNGLASGVSAIAAGHGHTCALTATGGVKCWGYNQHGQLGDGSTTTTPPYAKPAPVEVSGLESGVSAIVAGHGQTCALISPAGTVKCWGTNAYGELGDGTTANRAAPGEVSGLSGISALTAGYEHTCALATNGSVKCWGGGRWGDTKDPYNTYSAAPVDVSGLSGVSAVTAGHGHTCVLISGAVKCWGNNVFGQLGDGTNTDQLSPVDVKH